MATKIICFKRTKAFYDIIKRRKQCREYFIRWMEDNTNIMNLDKESDVTNLSYIHFKFVPHGRRSQGDITKSVVYERLAILFLGVGMAEGFEYGAESFFRYITSKGHSNLATRPSVLKREIMRYIQYKREKEKLVGIKSVEK
ncbi:MAG: hypothetical protein IJ540_10375 [Prevotella sp.]|nr:hypothetical protein [Prevotella sp.]